MGALEVLKDWWAEHDLTWRKPDLSGLFRAYPYPVEQVEQDLIKLAWLELTGGYPFPEAHMTKRSKGPGESHLFQSYENWKTEVLASDEPDGGFYLYEADVAKRYQERDALEEDELTLIYVFWTDISGRSPMIPDGFITHFYDYAVARTPPEGWTWKKMDLDTFGRFYIAVPIPPTLPRPSWHELMRRDRRIPKPRKTK